MKKKLLTGLLAASIIMTMTACAKDVEKKEENKEAQATEQLQNDGNELKTDEDTQGDTSGLYTVMSPDELISALEEKGYVYQYALKPLDEDDPERTHRLSVETEDALNTADIRYYSDTGETRYFNIGIFTNNEEDVEVFNNLITMIFVEESDKQAFLDFIYDEDATINLWRETEIAGLRCGAQRLDGEQYDRKYYYNATIYFIEEEE